MLNEIYISNRIAKLGVIRSFNLSAVKTCPGKTNLCTKYCYATKGHFQYESVQRKYESNYKISMSNDFVKLMNEKLSVNERFFRIHSSGDFYNQEYFDKWVEIARYNSHIKFLAYTRNYTIDTSNRPSNLVLIYTVDSETSKINSTVGRYAFVIPQNDDIKHGDTLEINSMMFTVCNESDCTKCLRCWNSHRNIAFMQKYKKYDTVKEFKVLAL